MFLKSYYCFWAFLLLKIYKVNRVGISKHFSTRDIIPKILATKRAIVKPWGPKQSKLALSKGADRETKNYPDIEIKLLKIVVINLRKGY